MDLLKRKPNRLKNYNYSQNGAYFITICTYDHKILFGDTGATSTSAKLIEAVFVKTIQQYSNVHCPKYVIMPNHFHAIIIIDRNDTEPAPSLPQVMQAFKRCSTIEYMKQVKSGFLPPFEKRVWQRSFFDHIIRNEQEYEKVWEYIENNPAAWEEDRFYRNYRADMEPLRADMESAPTTQ